MKKSILIPVILLVAVALVIAGLLIFMPGASQSNSPMIPSNNNPSSASTQVQNQVPPSGNSSSTTSSSGPSTHNVMISGFAFSPSTLTIKAGDTVTWTNQDSVAHTVVSDSGSEISSPSIPQGGSYSHTFTSAGTYNYHCSIHPSMTGQIIVA